MRMCAVRVCYIINIKLKDYQEQTKDEKINNTRTF